MEIERVVQLFDKAERALKEVDQIFQQLPEELGVRMLTISQELRRKKLLLLKTLLKCCAKKSLLIRVEDFSPIVDIDKDGEKVAVRPYSNVWYSPEEVIDKLDKGSPRLVDWVPFKEFIAVLFEEAKLEAQKVIDYSTFLKVIFKGKRVACKS